MSQGFKRSSKMKDQQFCIFVFVACLTIPIATRDTSPDVTTVFHAWAHGRFKDIQSNLRRKEFQRTNKGSNFLGGSFSNRDNVRYPVQFRREGQPQHLKR